MRAPARALGMPGLGLAILVVLIVGNPSAAATAPIELLPGFDRAVGPWLAPNAAASGLLGSACFDADPTRPALVLAAWALAGLTMLWAEDRRFGPRVPLAYDAAAAAAGRGSSHR